MQRCFSESEPDAALYGLQRRVVASTARGPPAATLAIIEISDVHHERMHHVRDGMLCLVSDVRLDHFREHVVVPTVRRVGDLLEHDV